MSTFSLGLLSMLYLAMLFLLASWAEWRSNLKKSLINNPYVYALTLAIYCTAWTYYGSVGRVIDNGLDFLTVYLGPTLFMFLGWSVLRKIIRICKIQRINSIADFISTRYGKSSSLGTLVTMVCLLAAIPYIGLQIKAISTSFSFLTNDSLSEKPIFRDNSLYIVIALIVFTFLFGTRKIAEDEKHEGMVFSIAIESVIKLIVFITLGIFITFYVFDGFEQIISKVPLIDLEKIFSIKNSVGYGNWFWHVFLSFGAFILLPRQFQVAVVENNSEEHLAQAMWLFPLYLLLINIFVVPLALSGEVIVANTTISNDMFVLGLPLNFDKNTMAFFVYIGGFSAATGMIIVESIAVSVMMSNNLLMPFLLKNPHLNTHVTRKPILYLKITRRISITLLILLGFMYYKYLSERSSLVSIGMTAFVAVLQFAPATFVGLFWKTGNKIGATLGLLSGIFCWFIFLILPSIADAGIFYQIIPIETFMSVLFSMTEVLQIKDLDQISNATFWSILVNSITYFFVSLNTPQTSSEHNLAALFVDVFENTRLFENSVVWKGKAKIKDISELLNSFIGEKKSKKLLTDFSNQNKISLNDNFADPQIVNFIEKNLAGIIGTTSARMMVASVTEEETITVEDVVEILKESQELILLNNQLNEKTERLKVLSDELKTSNDNLKKLDNLKDDFLTSVTHEIRTPLTSIKAFSEILYDNEDLKSEEKKHFLETIINESDRMSRLINQVLDLEKFDSGKVKLNVESLSIVKLITEVINTLEPQIHEKAIELKTIFEDKIPNFYGDRDKIIQVFINMISNSIKFVSHNDGLIEIKINTHEHFILINITDNGVGVAPELRELIFEKFYQIEHQNIRKPKGTGLGLAITKKIIELHHGHIILNDSKNKGAAFTIKLPLKINST